MTHTQIALSIWGALIAFLVLAFVCAMGKSFGYRNIIGALLAVVVVWGGGIGLVGYTIWAIFGGH